MKSQKRGFITLLALLFVISVFLTACGGYGGGSQQTVNARQGTEGIEMRFMQGNPPPQLYVGDPISVQLEVKNKGAFPQDPRNFAGGSTGELMPFEGYIFLEGFDPNVISFTVGGMRGGVSQQLPMYLYGKDQYNPLGTTEYITFEAPMGVQLPQSDTNFQQNYQATACYSYETIAMPTVCIDPDPFGTTIKRKVCNYQSVLNLGGGQGGPVAVTSVQEEVTSTTIKFKITIANSGNGILLDPEQWRENCPAADYRVTDFVNVHVYLDNQDITMSCRPGQPSNGLKVRLYNNKGTFVCDIIKPDRSVLAYLAPLQIILDYGYLESISGTLRVLPK